MNIAHTKSKSAQDVPFSGAVLVRRLALCCLVACAGVSTAQAAGYGDRERQQRNEQYDRRDRGQQQRDDEAREEQRRQQQAQQERHDQNNDRRGGRLTPDERRDLRRQINEAGIELYPRAPRR